MAHIAVSATAIPTQSAPTTFFQVIPPKAPKTNYYPKHKSRWEKEKIAAGDDHAFDSPDDPEWLGNWQLGEMVGKGASGMCRLTA
jgi:hypothetical protein